MPPPRGLAKSTFTLRACQRWPAPDFSEFGPFSTVCVGLQRLGQVDKIGPLCGQPEDLSHGSNTDETQRGPGTLTDITRLIRVAPWL